MSAYQLLFPIFIATTALMFSSCSTWNAVKSPDRTTVVSGIETPPTTRLDWIRSAQDFNQEELGSGEIDERIAQLVWKAVEEKQSTADIEIPINSKKMIYLGQKNPFELDDLKNASRNELRHYDSLLHIYKYGDVYISTQTDTKTDQQNVYYVARSLEILKTRYVEAYRKFFLDTKKFMSDEPKYGKYLNRNKAFWIGFNTNPREISSNNHFFITEQNTPLQNTRSVNVAAMNFHELKILGRNAANGSRLIYKMSSDEDNYRLHMREGIIVSIVHEMLHNYILYAAGVSEQYQKASSLRGRNHSDLAEEATVVNTVYKYFDRKGGLLQNQPAYYYPAIFYSNLAEIRILGLLTEYAAYYSTLVPTDTNLSDVFIIKGVLN